MNVMCGLNPGPPQALPQRAAFNNGKRQAVQASTASTASTDGQKVQPVLYRQSCWCCQYRQGSQYKECCQHRQYRQFRMCNQHRQYNQNSNACTIQAYKILPGPGFKASQYMQYRQSRQTGNVGKYGQHSQCIQVQAHDRAGKYVHQGTRNLQMESYCTIGVGITVNTKHIAQVVHVTLPGYSLQQKQAVEPGQVVQALYAKFREDRPDRQNRLHFKLQVGQVGQEGQVGQLRLLGQ